jgi:signal recognition particle subunit SRP54
VTRFEQAAKMMKTVAKGGMPQVPGMGPIPGGGFGGRGKQQQKKKGSRSGNPAKRAAENAALAAGVKPGAAAEPSGTGFGLAGAKQQAAPDLEQIQKLFGR